MQRVFTRVALCAAVFVVFGVVAGQALAAGDITISQVYGGGGNAGATYKNDFIELYNRGPASVSLAGWSVQYASSAGTTWQKTNISGTLDPGAYYLVQEAAGSGGTTALPTPNATGTIPMSATAGKVALVANQTLLSGSCPTGIADLVGFGSANCFEGTAATVAPSNTTAILRKGSGSVDTDDNGADFVVGAPNPRTSGGGSSNAPVNVTCPSSVSVAAGSSTSFDVSASDLDGRVADITAAGTTTSRTAFSPSLAVGAAASATFATSASLAAGNYTVSITATNDDVSPQTGSCAVSLTVTAPPTVLTIGAVQGSVPDSSDGSSFPSPHLGETVTVDGVVTEQTFEGGNHAFFLQNTPAKADGDPSSSDGIFVFLGHFTTLIGGYAPVVGDEIVMRGKVSEFSGQTELGTATIDHVVAHNVDIAPFTASPPADVDDAGRYWERHEGMFGVLPQGSTIDSPVHTYASTGDTEFYALAPDSPVSGRTDPYAVRAFRDAHPLDDQPGLFDNGNGYRVLVTDEGVKAAAGNVVVPLAAVHTFQTLAQPILGGVYYDFGKYSISASAQPQLDAGADPSQNDPPAAFDRTRAFSIANFNMENLYDFRNDPFDGCDFTGDPGCPGVSPPFDYPPDSDAVYQQRETWIAHQVVDDLHSPDVIAVAEAEDQDICTVVDWAMSCGATNNADGKPDTVQEVAVHIHAIGGPDYTAAYDRDGADARGIVSAFLYRTDRVSLADPTADDAVLGSSPTVSYRSPGLAYNTQVSNPKALNAQLPADVDKSTGVDGSNVFTRAPQVGHFLIWHSAVGTGHAQDVWVLANHFTSGPDSNVGQRREQAAYNAAIVAAIQHQDAAAKIDVAGDLNVYPRPDDPFAPPNTSDQLAPLYNGGLHDLFDSVLARNPASAYSYDYQGQAQDLDHQFVSDALFGDLVTVNEAHINSDWTPGAIPNRGTSDHDPMVSRWSLNSEPVVSAGGPYTVGEGSSVDLTATASDADGDPLTYSWDLTGDGTADATGATVPFDAASIDGPTDVTVTVSVSDGKSTTAATAVVHVTNVAPTATFDAPSQAVGGSTFTISLSNPADPSSADTAAGFTYAFDCGTGFGAYGSASSATCTAGYEGAQTVGGRIRDKDGGVTEHTASVQSTVTIDSLCSLVQDLSKNAGEANSLCVKLQHGQIAAFDHEVDAQTGKAFTAEQAALLERLAARL